jgi:antibiotic biosynthesis monooxygenase (ABM) superfamily enzyme
MATQIRSSFFLALFLFAATLVPSQPAPAQQFKEKAKLVGAGFQQLPQQGTSVAMSADGNTAIVGGPFDNGDIGAAWVFIASNMGWIQQGNKLVAGDAVGGAQQGFSVALSSDGNTAIVGGPLDSGGTGAAWVFTRSNGAWTQQGGKLVGNSGANAQQGSGVALSSDGNTAIVGGPLDNGAAGAAWVFTRSNGVWTQQGGKLVGTGAVGNAEQGFSVALSSDGYTALVGGIADHGSAGATWVFARSTNGRVWTQQGSKLVGTGAAGNARQGTGVALSANGNTALVGGIEDNMGNGAAWVFTRSRGGWTQQGSKLAGTNLAGRSVALSADGNTAIVGAQAVGVRVYTRNTRGLWTQLGSTITGTGMFGYSVSLDRLGRTLLIGAPTDDTGSGEVGAGWVYLRPQN